MRDESFKDGRQVLIHYRQHISIISFIDLNLLQVYQSLKEYNKYKQNNQHLMMNYSENSTQ